MNIRANILRCIRNDNFQEFNSILEREGVPTASDLTDHYGCNILHELSCITNISIIHFYYRIINILSYESFQSLLNPTPSQEAQLTPLQLAISNGAVVNFI